MTKPFLFVLSVFLFITTMGCGNDTAGPGATVRAFYVDHSQGDDTAGNGSLDRPWKSIQKAATTMEAGDTCYIRGGVYGEIVRPQNSGTSDKPITFRPYQDEKVTISGGDRITGWTRHEGDIYQAPMGWDIDGGDGNIVFVGGTLGAEAQWPNISDRLDRSQYARVDNGGVADAASGTLQITDGALQELATADLEGAIVVAVPARGYFAQTSPVRGFDAAKNQIALDPFIMTHYRPEKGNAYYLTRSLSLLDAANEWYRDSQEDRLYVQMPAGKDPKDHVVEAKRRADAFDLADRSFIDIIGIDFRMAGIRSNDNTEGVLLQRCTFTTVGRNLARHKSYGGIMFHNFSPALTLDGRNNTMRECEVKEMFGSGVTVRGTGHRLINNYIHDVDYELSNQSGLRLNGFELLVAHNTITRCGRVALGGNFQRCDIKFNHISHGNMVTLDAGLIAMGNYDYQNTRLHHNIIAHSRGRQNALFYPDNLNANILFYRNILFDGKAMQVNTPSYSVLVFNNTSHNGRFKYWPRRLKARNTLLFNNILTKGVQGGGGQVTRANLVKTDPKYVNPGKHDFALQPSSPAIDAGTEISGVTDGYLGKAPDIGALEHGAPDWTVHVGHDFSKTPEPDFDTQPIQYMNLLAQGGFEGTDLSVWSTTGKPEVISQLVWDYKGAALAHMNYKAASLGSGDRLQQTIKNLQPNTRYRFTFWAKIGGQIFQAEDSDEKSTRDHWHAAPAYFRNTEYVGPFKTGDYIAFKDVTLDGAYNRFAVGMNKATSGKGKIEVRLRSPTGEKVGEVALKAYSKHWKYVWGDLRGATGTHDVYFVFTDTSGGSVLLDCVQFSNVESSNGKLQFSLPGTVTFGVSGYGGTMVSKEVTSTDWSQAPYTIEFTTGPKAKSAVVFVEKLDGAYRAYVDDLGVTEVLQQAGNVSF